MIMARGGKASERGYSREEKRNVEKIGYRHATMINSIRINVTTRFTIENLNTTFKISQFDLWFWLMEFTNFHNEFHEKNFIIRLGNKCLNKKCYSHALYNRD